MNHLENILYLFLIIIIGFLVRRGRFVSKQARPVLSQFVLQVALPFMILDSMRFNFDAQILTNALVILGIGAVTFVVSIAVSELSSKFWNLPSEQMASYHFAMVLPNTGFLGLPLLKATLGAEAAFYGAMIQLIFITVNWTYGVYVFTREDGKRIELKKLLNPSIVALIIGFFLFLFSIKFPSVIYRMVESIGNTATPLTMLTIGMMLAEMKLKDFTSLGKPFILTAYRNVVFPVVLYFILRAFGVEGLLLQVLVIDFAMPIAANTAIFAQGYDKDYQTAAKLVMISTLFAIVTIPLIVGFVT